MNVTVYCGANLGNDPAYEKAARELGGWIARQGATLVYGAGSLGLMGVVADAVAAGGGNIVGVIPEFLAAKEIPHDAIDELIVVDDMQQRKRIMYERADLFVVLPGGLGTLEELAEIASWTKIGQSTSPIAVYDTTGFYAPLRDLLARMVGEGFLTEGESRNLLFVDDLDELHGHLENYRPESCL